MVQDYQKLIEGDEWEAGDDEEEKVESIDLTQTDDLQLLHQNTKVDFAFHLSEVEKVNYQ